MINCIIIDDEPLAQSLVSSFVQRTPFLRLIACFGNAWEAYHALNGLEVQLIFLDIEMPDITGMQFARILRNGNLRQRPSIIYTTAYPHYAIESYKVDAVDYLLKPFHYEDFLRAADKARRNLEGCEGLRQTPAQAGSAGQGYLFFKVDHQLIQVSHEDFLYVEAFRDYIKVYTCVHDKPLMSLTTLKSVEEKLPAGQFLRVHKSFVVALGKIDSITKSAVHIGNAVITIGDQYRDGLRQFVEKWSI